MLPRFDRYLLAQLVVVFGFFSLVLVSIYWINQAVRLVDQLLANGQNTLVFLEFTALTLPNVIRHVLPMASFAAAVYAGNRLASESELVVMQTTGYSPMRLARPVLVFGLFTAVLVSILTHVLVPASQAEYNRRQGEINANVTARFLTEGTFLHPANGLTFYIREITTDGELRDVFLSDATIEGERTDYSAKRARIVRTDGGPKLVMFEGLAQTLRLADRSLATTAFRDLSYDIGSLVSTRSNQRRTLNELSTREALFPDQAVLDETRASLGRILYEGHGRIVQALQSAIAALVGFACLLVGGFSRFGLWRQIIGGVFALIVLKTLDNAFGGLVRAGNAPWPMMYVGSAIGLLTAWGLLWIAARPHIFAQRVPA